MIVAFQPGGSIKDARVVLRHDEKIPKEYNTKDAIIYREDKDNPREWHLVKGKYTVFPPDSDLLSQPELPDVSLGLTIIEVGDKLYEHVDIIRMEEDDGTAK